ncbi:MAG: response regulator [Pseudomonadales bacterium]|nr:response regulator [Pseudomonadales bacterium]
MAVIKYSTKKVLIIEDQAAMCTQLKSMLENLGIQDINVAKTGEDAIHKLNLQPYDIVLADYELGRGKDGQQVLEEARHTKLLKASSIFILVTASQTVEMVMGALEYHPDGYIAKPMTFEDLKTRLDRILKTKLIYYEINRAIDLNSIDGALEACDQLILDQPKFALPTYRIKGRLLMDAHRMDEAEELYETVIDIRKVAWALLGMAKVMYYQSRYDEGRNILQRLANSNEKYVEAFDWLAKIFEAQGNTKEAQKILQRAVELSPKAILRQQHLSKMAEINDDWNVAVQASRRSVDLGKHSCHKTPKSYLRLANALQPQLLDGGSRSKQNATAEVFRTLEDLKKEYNTDQDVQIRASLLEGNSYKNLGRNDDAKTATAQALKYYEALSEDPSPDLALEVGKGMVKNLDIEEAMNFINDPKQQAMFDNNTNDYLKEVVTKANEEMVLENIDTFNNKGVELFEKDQLQESIDMFEQAASNDAASLSIVLNTVQAYVTFMQKKGPSEHAILKCSKHFTRLEKIPEDDKRHKRFRKLKIMFDELEKML